MSVNPQSEFLREPNLLIPGKKPVGNVVINRTNALGKKVRAFAFKSTHVMNVDKYEYGSFGGRQAFDFDGTTDSARIDESWDFDVSKHSIYTIVKAPNAPIDPGTGIYENVLATDSGGIHWDHSVTGFPGSCNYYDGITYPKVQYNLLGDTWYGLGYTIDLGVHAYQDGIYMGSAGTLDADPSGNQYRLRLGASPSDIEKWEGNMELVLYLDPLTTIEHASLHADPYQVFKPA